jgi:cytochrome d ubiquinol oxidase subunit II
LVDQYGGTRLGRQELGAEMIDDFDGALWTRQLLSLIFRGLVFEFRFRDADHRTFWDHGFAVGSALAAFSQGVVLGAFIQGFTVEGRIFVGSSLDCFTPFSIVTGLALVVGCALLGAGWLVIKAEGKCSNGRRRSVAAA